MRLLIATLVAVDVGEIAMHDMISFLSTNDKLVTAWTAIAALFVSIISIVVAVVNMTMQRAHNRKGVLPIGHISVADYENQLSVRLRNDGVGPMVVKKATVMKGGDSQQTKLAIIEFMPELPNGILWSIFVGDISGRAVSAEDKIILISLEGDQEDAGFIAARRMIREALSDLTIKVEYENIYGERMPPVSRRLDWFARHLKAELSPGLPLR
jgi:hypothetical protein